MSGYLQSLINKFSDILKPGSKLEYKKYNSAPSADKSNFISHIKIRLSFNFLKKKKILKDINSHCQEKYVWLPPISN